MLDDTEKSDTDAITSKTFSELDENIHKILADANIKTLSELADFRLMNFKKFVKLTKI